MLIIHFILFCVNNECRKNTQVLVTVCPAKDLRFGKASNKEVNRLIFPFEAVLLSID